MFKHPKEVCMSYLEHCMLSLKFSYILFVGSIKALTSGLMVFATATGTAIFGILIDYGFTINSIAIFSSIYIATIVLLLFFIRGKIEPTYL